MTAAGGSADGPGAPPRASRRRAVVIGALVLAVALVGGGVALAMAAGSDDGDGDAGDADAAPLDIAVVGDSLIEQSRDQVQVHADVQGLTVESVAFGGSAPCDWMDAFERFAADRPRHLIISFAGNDSTPCINPGGGPPRDPQTIADAYAEMMPGILDLFAGTGTEVYLVLPPPVGPPASEPAAAAIRATYRELASDRPEITIVDPAPLLGPDGAFHLTLPCEPWEADVCGADGTVTVRNADGIHLAPAGGERYARILLEAIGRPVDG